MTQLRITRITTANRKMLMNRVTRAGIAQKIAPSGLPKPAIRATVANSRALTSQASTREAMSSPA